MMRTYAYYMADLNRSRTASHGIINYSLGLLSALAGLLEHDERLTVLGSSRVKSEMEELLPDLSRVDWYLTAEPSPIKRLLVDHVQSLYWARRAKADLLHFPKGFIPLWNPTAVKTVATVHDDIPLRYAAGDFGSDAVANRSRYFSWAIKHTMSRADAVLAVSEFTEGRLEAEYPGHRAPIRVTHEGAHPMVIAQGHTWPKDRYLVVFGSVHPHKSTGTTVDYALRYLAESDSDLELLVLGKVDDDVAAAISSSSRARRMEGFVATSDLVEIIARARALLWGSSYEGFGLPPLEAAILGTPVVYRPIPAVTEVMGSTHFPFEDSFPGFAKALNSALASTEEDLAAFGRELGSRFDWQSVADRTLNVYREVL